jgi:hypothetical protein
MRLPSVPTPAMVDHLNTTYFHRVWNAPDDHGGANFDLHKAARRLQIGAVPVNLSVVGLPTTDKVYAVYRASANVFGRFINFLNDTWVLDTDITKTHTVSLTTYTTGGRMLPSGCVHLRYDRLKGYVLIAIEHTYTSKCTGLSFPDLHMTVFKDTTRQTPTTSKVFIVSAASTGVNSAVFVKGEITATHTRYPAGTMVYVNGWLYDFDRLPLLSSGDVVEIQCDPDILSYCDITVDDNTTGYHSVMYGEYREVLHIPKVLNPENFVITNDTLMVGVFDGATGKGVYGHKLDPHSLESITHNDFSVSRSVLQAFQNSLSAQGIYVRLYIHMATNPHSVGRDVNLLEDLYSLPDEEIQRQLIGGSQHQITEWHAAALEQSAYLSLLYNFDGFPKETILSQYSAALGYYDVASTLAQSIVSYTYLGASVSVAKPSRLTGYPCEIIVYHDGRKLPNHALYITQSNRSITIGLTDATYVEIGAELTVYITEGGERIPRKFSPTTQTPSIIMDSDDYDVMQIISYTQDQKTWQSTTRKGYKALPISPADYTVVVNTNGTATFTFSATHWGQSFYLIPVSAMTSQTYNLDTMLASKQSIIIPMTMTDEDNMVIPLIGYRTLEVYLNGYRLLEGLDYTCDPIMGTNNDVLQTVVMVSNNTYLDLVHAGNILEVIVHGDSVVSSDTGYVISNMMNRDVPPMLWSKTCGRVFARGVLITDLEESGSTLISNTPIADGSPYLTQWSLPFSVAKLMVGISPNHDNDLRVRVGRLLNLTPPVYPDTVSIRELYALYSPYLAKIVSDVASGALVIGDEPILNLFLQQFSAYTILAARDPVVDASNDKVDRRFVSLAAHYANFSVQNPQQMILVQKLISLVLTPSELSIKDVLL